MSPKRIALGSVCDFSYGDGLVESQRSGGRFPVYGSNGVVGWHDQPLTKGPTIVIGRKGSIGEVHFSEHPCWAIDTTYYVESTKLPCDLRWLYYMLLAVDLTRLNKSAAVPGLNREDAYREEIPWLPLVEQRRIATLLSRADRLRRLRREALAMGARWLQAVFVEMFGDVRKSTMVELESVLDGEPKNGLYLPAEKYGRGAPIIRITEFYDGVLADPSHFKRVEATAKEIAEFSVENGEILINRVNSLDYLGKCALVKGLLEPTLFESNMMRLRLDPKKISPVYLASFLSSPMSHAQILRMARKAVNQASINQGDVRSLVIPLPPLKLQLQFARIAQRYARLRGQQAEAGRQAEGLLAGVLERAFRGEG
jgi:type I restriction enzyme S subunit